MTAPICHVPGTKPPTDQPTNTSQSIPIATDLASALMAINALRRAVMRLQGQDANPTGKAPKIPQENKRVQWKEQSRVVEKVRIFQNNDKSSSNWVDVEQINRLVMVDKNTGQTWEWRRK